MSQEQEELTVAQALRKIKKLKGQLGEVQARATAGVSYEQTKVPEFRFKESVDELFALQTTLVDLESKVAVANATFNIKGLDGKDVSLAFAIRALQELKSKIAFLKSLSLINEVRKERQLEWDDATGRSVAVTTEVTWVSDLSMKERDKLVRDLQDQFEELNNRVETANHRAVLSR